MELPMTKVRNIIFILLTIPVLLVLIWLFAVPEQLIKEQIDEELSRSRSNNVRLSIDGLRKGVLFTLHADSLNMHIDNKPAISITEFTGNFTPRYLLDKKLGFLINGKIGTGNVHGILKLPLEGDIKIERAELSAISYLSRFGIDIDGNLSSDINILNETVNVVFEIPDLDIAESALAAVPFLNTFHKMQGALSVQNNTVYFDSVSLEGEKGYARLKGTIKNGVMNLVLEIMPLAGKLNTLESMLLGKYIVSPGYYSIPIKGPLM